MSEKPRTSQDIQQEHMNLALKAGNIAYSIQESEKQLKMIYDTMQSLSLEFVRVRQVESDQEAAAAKQADSAKEGS